MIRWVRKAKIIPGKYLDALQWAKDTRTYTQEKFEGGEVNIYMESFGDVGTMCWMVDFNNMAELELAGQVLDQDDGYQERLKSAAELFMPGTVDKVYSTIN